VSHTLEEIAKLTGAELRGTGGRSIEGVATLINATSEQLSFFTNSRYHHDLLQTQAGAVVLAAEDVDDCPVTALIVDNPRAVYAQIVRLLHPESKPQSGIDPTASIDRGADIDPTAWIGPNAVVEAGAVVAARVQIGSGSVVGRGAEIGADTRLAANVTLYERVSIGQRCLIHSGAVIGADGFGFANNSGVWDKVPQLGSVVIGDDVEIGACTTIDRGALEDTVIENGVKLDNLIQIAHNVHIGEHTAMAACTGIAGSTRVGKRCTLAGGVILVGHIELVDDVHVTCMSLVTKSINKPGSYSSGSPLQESGEWRKNAVRVKQLDAMARKLKTLERG